MTVIRKVDSAAQCTSHLYGTLLMVSGLFKEIANSIRTSVQWTHAYASANTPEYDGSNLLT